jgi:nucleoside-diphosphate-sugar epimerase
MHGRAEALENVVRILLLGGTNFIGPAVVERLRDLGHDVTVFHRGRHENGDLSGVAHIHGDRAALDAHAAEFRAAAPDVVIAMGLMFERDAVAAVAAFRGLARRIVAISSIDVYRAYGRMHGSEPGPVEPMPLTEDSPLREKLFPYRGERADAAMDDYDKILVEQAVMSDPELQGTVLRLPAVHGERDYQHRLFMEVARMDAGRPAIIVPEAQWSWRWPRGYAGNIADAIGLVATDSRAVGRVYHVAEETALPMADWIRRVADVTGWTGKIVAVPDDLLPPHLQPKGNFAQDIVVDSSRIRRELGYAERVLPGEGVRRAVAWERAHPPKSAAQWLDFPAEDAALAALRGGR